VTMLGLVLRRSRTAAIPSRAWSRSPRLGSPELVRTRSSTRARPPSPTRPTVGGGRGRAVQDDPHRAASMHGVSSPVAGIRGLVTPRRGAW